MGRPHACVGCGSLATHDDEGECPDCGTPFSVCGECGDAICPLCFGEQTHVQVYKAQVSTYDAGAQPKTLYPWWSYERQTEEYSHGPLTSVWKWLRGSIKWP